MKTFKRQFTLLIVGLLLVINAATAHNTLTGSTPSDNAVLTESPEFIELSFSDATYLEKVELINEDDDKASLEFEQATMASRQFSVALPPLANGEYRIRWLVIGDDTHEITGEVTFTVTGVEITE